MLLLQTHDQVSDEEAKARADFDIRWKVALGVAIDEKPFAKSTLQLFRAYLILHEKVRAVFQCSLQFARQTGYIKGHRLKAALDISYILGRGAVKDTYNLLADGIAQTVRALVAVDTHGHSPWHFVIQASLDSLRPSSHSPTGKTHGILPLWVIRGQES